MPDTDTTLLIVIAVELFLMLVMMFAARVRQP